MRFKDYNMRIHSENLDRLCKALTELQGAVLVLSLDSQAQKQRETEAGRQEREQHLCGARDSVCLVAEAELAHLVLSKRKHGARLWKERTVSQKGKEH